MFQRIFREEDRDDETVNHWEKKFSHRKDQNVLLIFLQRVNVQRYSPERLLNFA